MRTDYGHCYRSEHPRIQIQKGATPTKRSAFSPSFNDQKTSAQRAYALCDTSVFSSQCLQSPRKCRPTNYYQCARTTSGRAFFQFSSLIDGVSFHRDAHVWAPLPHHYRISDQTRREKILTPAAPDV